MHFNDAAESTYLSVSFAAGLADVTELKDAPALTCLTSPRPPSKEGTRSIGAPETALVFLE